MNKIINYFLLWLLLIITVINCNVQLYSQVCNAEEVNVEKSGDVSIEGQYPCCKKHDRKVVYDHDGGIDDFIALMLMQLSPHIELLGVTITPADCIPEDAVVTTQKLLNLFGNSHIPVASGSIGGLHPFPPNFRQQAHFVQHLPDLISLPIVNDSQISTLPAHQLIMDILKNAEDNSITLLMVGPATNLVYALKDCGQICRNKIDEVIWMAGALDVQGNVLDLHHTWHAEWNAYWDPWASRELSRSGLNITLFPLDVTNAVPVTEDFLERLAEFRHKEIARLAGQHWSSVVGGIQGFELQYFMWDTLTVAHTLVDNLVEMQMMEVDFVVDNFVEGKSVKAPGSGQWMQVAVKTDVDRLEQFILCTFDEDFKQK